MSPGKHATLQLFRSVSPITIECHDLIRSMTLAFTANKPFEQIPVPVVIHSTCNMTTINNISGFLSVDDGERYYSRHGKGHDRGLPTRCPTDDVFKIVMSAARSPVHHFTNIRVLLSVGQRSGTQQFVFPFRSGHGTQRHLTNFTPSLMTND